MGILLVFDVTDEKSFNSTFLTDKTSATGTKTSNSMQVKACARFLLATRATGKTSGCVIADKAVSTEQAQALADELGLTYVETSAKSSSNVDEAFFKLAQQVKDHLVDQGITSNTQTGSAGNGNVGVDSSFTGKQGGCC